MPLVLEWGEKTPAFFVYVTEGAPLSCLDGGDMDLEAWPAQSSEGLSHTVWPMHVKALTVSVLKDARDGGAL